MVSVIFFFSSRRRHTRFSRDWSSDVCSSDLGVVFIEKMQLYIVWSHYFIVDKIRIGTPCKIVYIWCDKMPGKCFLFFRNIYFYTLIFVAMTNFVFVL